MGDAKREGLRAAAAVLARTMRRVAGRKTNETARMVTAYFSGADEMVVSAGLPIGAYGWNPVQALMFDDNRRHPLFGNKKYWYRQGYYPITEATVKLAATSAAEAYADAAVPLMLKEHGLSD